MNTLIKRNMKLALTAVLIGVSVIPAYAGGGKGKGGKKALEALTGKVPVAGTIPGKRLPVPPRIPPTLKGTTVSNAALSAAVEQKVTVQALTEQMISSLGLDERDLRTNGFIQTTPLLKSAIEGKISLDQLVNYEIMTHPHSSNAAMWQRIKDTDISLVFDTPIEETDVYLWLNKKKMAAFSRHWKDHIEVRTDFSELITPHTPTFIPVDSRINALKDVANSQKETNATSQITLTMIVAKIDNAIFVEQNGKMYINVNALKKIRSYEEAIFKLSIRTFEDGSYSSAFPTIINLRNKQITDALKAANNTMTPQFQGVPQADVTTQRTAEEIQSLLENLDPGNPPSF